MKITEKAYAKINLALRVMDKSCGFHAVDTVVCTVDLYDEVCLSPRNDKEVILRAVDGAAAFSEALTTENDNACKAVRLFSKTFGTNGADVEIKKNIPFCGGMGGSSTDAAAALRAMRRLYGNLGDLKPLADSLGSDTSYMLDGGFARLSGRGEQVSRFACDRVLFLVAVYGEGGVDTGKCYAALDALRSKKKYDNSIHQCSAVADKICEMPVKEHIAELIRSLIFDKLRCDLIKNDMFDAACSLNDSVRAAYAEISKLAPDAVSMSGSGSTVFGLFDTRARADRAAEQLRKIFKYVYSLQTV